MKRTIELNWSKNYDFHGNLARNGTFDVAEDIRKEFGQLFGIYMFIEDTSMEQARRDAIDEWRSSQGLSHGMGRKKVIYIGIVKSDQRDFITRMREHHKDWIYQYKQPGQLFVKFSTCYYKCDEAELPQLIEDAESVLIWDQKPYENTAKIKNLKMVEDIVVKNSGSHSPLPARIETVDA